MSPVHGQLLLGGAALRDLNLLLDGDDASPHSCSGSFIVDRTQGHLLELNRQYLFQQADGRSAKVAVTRVTPVGESLRVQIRDWDGPTRE